MTRLILDQPIEPELSITCRDACHRVVKVLRKHVGDTLTVIHPATESAYATTILACSPKQLVLQVGKKLADAPSPLPHITLAAALIKGQRWDWLLQKATELGVRAIQPLSTEHTVVKWDNNDTHKLARWADITKAAVAQCDGRFLPAIHTPKPIAEFYTGDLPQQLAQPNHHGFVLMEQGPNRQPFNAVLTPLVGTASHITLVIGPEGGLSQAEADGLIAAGCTNVLLGTRVLRAETAAIAALSAVAYAFD